MPAMNMKECRQRCLDCHVVCLDTLNHCLQAGGEHVKRDHVRLMMDCIQICATSADFMIRESPFHHLTCKACGEICAACAEDCERLGDEHMKNCAEACRKCAESCRAMAAA